MLLYELVDAHDHLGALLSQLKSEDRIEEAEYAIQLGHVFAHLNRAWHGRDDASLDAITADQHAERSKYPTDLPPIG